MMDVLSSDSDLTCEDGTDCRNYGGLDGISEAKELLADMIEVPADNIIIYGNSSLNVMYDTISRSVTHGVMGIPRGASLTRLNSCVRYRDMTDISPLLNILASR